METKNTTKVTVEATVNAPIEKVWQYWSAPEHITQWNFAIDSWQCPSATNDLREGGSFTSRMEAKDGSFGFDFGGVYTKVEEHKIIEYAMSDGRTVQVNFYAENNATRVVETFDAENENDIEMQRGGWQAILDNFKKYAEAN